MKTATIHITTSAENKNRWVRTAQRDGKKLGDWITEIIEAHRESLDMEKITEKQFDFLASKQARRSTAAARRVLVDGIGIREAATEMGVTFQTVAQAAKKIKATHAAALEAYGTSSNKNN